MNVDQFIRAVGCTAERAEVWFEPFKAAMALHAIDRPLRQAALLAEVGHESGGLARVVENLNYSAQGMMRAWPARFPTIESAHYYEPSPERLANFVYANRMGNGPYASGDGWRYRGRGPIQITGVDNYRKMGKALGLDLVENPDLLSQPTPGALSSCRFFVDIGGNDLADGSLIDAISQRVQGVSSPEKVLGLVDRRERFAAALLVLTKGTT